MRSSITDSMARVSCDAIHDQSSSSARTSDYAVSLYDHSGNSVTVCIDGETLIDKLRQLYILQDAPHHDL